MEKSITEWGRLQYIEPTNIYNKYNSGYGEDIFFPYEDYCMSVDLTVHITNRYSCGWASKNNRKRTLNFSSSNNTISFLGGSKISNFLNSGYLTTNFTDISMTNPGENTSECLGIESISITYNSWMHPEVTIKFIDIRGATVMQPSEASYYNENDFGMSRELYKSLFTFPYPMFELKVKGFYGKGVTYKLAVSKSDIELDSESGNFVIVVSFIGFMYGIYADLPMTFIACAPYIPGGKEYWETKVNDGTFMFKDSSGQPSKPMCKIPELRTNIAKAASNEEFKNITANEKENGIVVQNQIDALRTLIDLYPLKNFETIGNLPYFYYVGNYEDSYNINGKIENFYKELKSYKDSYKVDYLKYFDSFKTIKESEKNNITLCEITDKDEIKFHNEGVFLGTTGDNILKLNEFILEKSKILNTTKLYLVHVDKNGVKNFEDFNNEISEQINFLEKDKNNEELLYKAKEMALIEKLIGFKPSIRNIYELIFAHIETFFHCFYEQTRKISDQIDSEDKIRLKNTYGINPGETDTEDFTTNSDGTFSLNNFLPPYTAFYKNVTNGIVNKETSMTTNKKEMVWPENFKSSTSNLEEVKFVKALINGSELYYEDNKAQEEYSNSNQDNNTISDAPTSYIGNFIPLTTYDFMYKDKMENPYTNIVEKIRNNEDIEGDIIGAFALRAFYYNAIHNNKGEAKSFGVLEALNLFKAVGKTVSNNFLNFIKKYADNSNNKAERKDFINIITTSSSKTGETWRFNDNSTLFRETSKDDLIYNLHETMLPVGSFNFVKIKDYYAEDDLCKNNSLLSVNVPNKDDEICSNSFKIFDSKVYIKNIINELEKEIKDTAKLAVENNDTDYIENYGKIHNQYRTLSNYNSIDNNNSLLNYNNDLIISIKDDKNIDGDSLRKLLIENTDIVNDNNYLIKKPLNNAFIKNSNNKYTKTDVNVYYYDEFKEIDNKLIKAFIFLKYTPIYCYNIDDNGILDKNNNGITLYLSLLKEGSYYWYNENKEVVNIYDKFFSKIEDNFEPKGCTPSRKETLKKEFTNWANSKDFEDIDKYLALQEIYNNENYLYLDNQSQTKESISLQTILKKLYFKVVTVFDLYNGIDNTIITSSSKEMLKSFQGFTSELNKIYKNIIDKIDNKNSQDAYIRDVISKEEVSNPFKSEDLYLSTYITLKSLYDKWLCAPPGDPTLVWSLEKEKGSNKLSDFNNFIYTDSFYHDIGYVFPINITKISEWLDSCIPSTNIETTEGVLGYNGKTVYNFLTEVAQDSGGMLLAIPQRFGSYDTKSMLDTFRAYPLYSDWNTDESSFVFMYTYKPSEHLGDMETKCEDMNGYIREGDGIDLTNKEIMGLIVNDDGYTIPAFGVTYAKQNQSMFKNIKLSTADAGVTEAGLKATFNIASKASSGPRETMLYGQDLYRIYSQYSYRCSVEMLGNAQITPLMYFQLNNVPLWKGGYQILKVNHQISAGDFKTTFEGIRMNRNSIPFTESVGITIKDTGNHKLVNNDNNVITNNNLDNMTDVKGNSSVFVDKIDFNENNVSETKPIICLTPAHGPETGKKLEWEWSSRVVDKIIQLLKLETYDDGSTYNIQRCNKNGKNTSATGYSMRETKNIINKFGSKKVISLTPHWNGGGGNRFEVLTHWEGYTRPDSSVLANCMKEAVEERIKNKAEMFPDNLAKFSNGIGETVRIIPLDYYSKTQSENDDGAPRLNCACILTENWYPDFDCNTGKGAPSQWMMGNITEDLFYHWLTSEKGVEEIAMMHVNAIKKYINSLL